MIKMCFSYRRNGQSVNPLEGEAMGNPLEAANETFDTAKISDAVRLLGPNSLVSRGSAGKVWGISHQDTPQTPNEIPYLEKTLQACAEENEVGCQWRLVYLNGLRPLAALAKFAHPTTLGVRSRDIFLPYETETIPGLTESASKLIEQHAWKSIWGNLIRPAGYRLIDFKPRYKGRTWAQQELLLQQFDFARADDWSVLEAMISLAVVHQEEVLSNGEAHWGFPIDVAPEEGDKEDEKGWLVSDDQANPLKITFTNAGICLDRLWSAKKKWNWLGVCPMIEPQIKRLQSPILKL